MTPEFILRHAIDANQYLSHVGQSPESLPHWQQPDIIRQRALSAIEDLQQYPGYWNDDSKPVIVTDWNLFDRRAASLIERLGYEIDWPDSCIGCDHCYKATHTSPQYYGDLRTAHLTDDCALCPNCARERFEDDILPSLINNPRSADKTGIDLTQFGFEKYNGTYENGLHLGQTDDPHHILRDRLAEWPAAEIVFQISDAGQFDISFTCWYRFPSED